jgi:hypothetical protein
MERLLTGGQPSPHEHIRHETVGDRLKALVERRGLRRGRGQGGDDEPCPEMAQ